MKDKKIVITGGANGLGAAVARKLCALGANIVIVDIDDVRGEKFASEIGAHFVLGNVADTQGQYESHEAIVKRFGDDHIDVLINNAGIWFDRDHGESNPSNRQHLFDTNVLGVAGMTDCFLPAMRAKNSGLVLNIVSVAALSAIDLEAIDWKIYAASKAAVARYSDALREELKNTKIKVTQVFPGGFDSNIFETSGWAKNIAHNQDWMMRADDVADCVMFAITRPEDVFISSIVVEKKDVNETSPL